MSALASLLDELPEPDEAARGAVAARAAEILRPGAALGRLDQLAVWLAGWQRTPRPHVRRPAALVFAADHGVAAASRVSAYPTNVTAAMLAAFRAGRATINAFAAEVGAEVAAVDVGVDRPTADLRAEPALSTERFDEVVGAAVEHVGEIDADLLVLGDMGIGNTTASAALVAAITDRSPQRWVGRGSGVDDEGLARKRDAVARALRRVEGITDPIELLRQVGGAELAALAAATAAARRRSLPVVLDGFVVGAAVLALHAARPGSLDHCVAGHRSAEAGHERLLQLLGTPPLLDLGMRLGEGSGAMAAVPLLRMACAGVTAVPTFGEWFG